MDPNSKALSEENLKKYVSTLGSSYAEDKYGINDGFPVLGWQNKKQLENETE